MILLVRLVAWLLLAAISILMLVPADLRPVTPMPHKIEHVVAFLLLGGTFALGYRRHISSAGLVLVLIAGGLEALQLLMPERHARLGDFLVDAAGACVGIAIVTMLDRVRRPSRPGP